MLRKDAIKTLELNKNSIFDQYQKGIPHQIIAENLGLHISTISKFIKRSGLPSRKRPKARLVYKPRNFNESYFENIDCEHKAYWLGFFMADGCIHHRRNSDVHYVNLSLHKQDIEHIRKFQDCINCSNKIYTVKKTNMRTLSLNSTIMFNDLNNLGCTERKTLTLEFPKINENLIRHFIRGYFDGDGCIRLTKSNYLRFNVAGRKEFIDIIALELKKKEIKYCMYKHSKCNTYYLDVCSKDSIKKIRNYLYQDASMYLDRKHDNFFGRIT
jgi:DNA-binding transcriptional regulator WhiA